MFCRFVVFSIFKNNFPNFYSAQCKYLIPSSFFSSLYSISSSSAAKIGSFIIFLNTNIFDPMISITLLYPPNLCILGYQLLFCIHTHLCILGYHLLSCIHPHLCILGYQLVSCIHPHLCIFGY